MRLEVEEGFPQAVAGPLDFVRPDVLELLAAAPPVEVALLIPGFLAAAAPLMEADRAGGGKDCRRSVPGERSKSSTPVVFRLR